MKVAYLSLVFVVTVMLPMLLANSLGSRVAQPSFLMTGPGGFYPVSEDSAVHSTGSGDDLSVDDISAPEWSSDSKCAGWENDCLPVSGQVKSQSDHPAFSVGSYQGRWVLAFGISCAVRVEPVKVSVLWNTTGMGSLTSSLWAGLIAILGVVTNKQSERSSTSPPTFRKFRPRLTTDTVSFRIDSNLRANLEDEAKKNRTSLNTLVSQILFRYSDWWRYAGRLGLIPVSKDLLRDVFKSLDKPELEELGRKFAETSGREHVLYLYQQISLGTILQFLDLWSSHFDAYEHRYDGKMHFYTVHHDINLNFSIFVKEFVSTMIMGTVPRTVRFETVGPNSVTFNFEG